MVFLVSAVLAAAIFTTAVLCFLVLLIVVILIFHILILLLMRFGKQRLGSSLIIAERPRKVSVNPRILAPLCKEDKFSTLPWLRAYTHIRCKSKE